MLGLHESTSWKARSESSASNENKNSSFPIVRPLLFAVMHIRDRRGLLHWQKPEYVPYKAIGEPQFFLQRKDMNGFNHPRIRKALVNTQVAESKTVFWSWEVVKIHSQLSRELLFFFGDTLFRELRYTANQFEWQGRELLSIITWGGTTNCFFFLFYLIYI